VPSTTLDVCVYGEKRFRPPNVIKIDVEGAELEVLAGAARAICEFHPLMFLELHSAELHRDCRDFLLARDYDIADARGQLTASWKPTNR
jgi:hypothetical protein